jgi:hypothetical protein
MMMMMVPDYRIWSPGKGGIFCMLMRGNLSVFLEDGAPKSPAIFTYISLFARKREKPERERGREREREEKEKEMENRNKTFKYLLRGHC